jgi:ethanolamine ammonia-lyase small subunit
VKGIIMQNTDPPSPTANNPASTMDANPTITSNPWQALRQLTQARIALGRSGVSLPTGAQLEFQLAHARARDAVHLALDADALAQAFAQDALPCVQAHSAARDRQHYLQRPDLGRKLNEASRQRLLEACAQESTQMHDLALVLVDGLSSLALAQNARPFLQALLPRLRQDGLSLAPLVIVQQGRVAIGDEVGELLRAKAVLVLIGERPGLSSPDSMGLYFTWAPRVGLQDASRNCISNVRPAGLSYDEAAHKLHYLLGEARRRGLSGVELKDETGSAEMLAVAGSGRGNFLLVDGGLGKR